MGMIRPGEPEGAWWELWWRYLVTISCLTSLGLRQERDALYFRGLSGIMFVGVPAGALCFPRQRSRFSGHCPA